MPFQRGGWGWWPETHRRIDRRREAHQRVLGGPRQWSELAAEAEGVSAGGGTGTPECTENSLLTLNKIPFDSVFFMGGRGKQGEKERMTAHCRCSSPWTGPPRGARRRGPVAPFPEPHPLHKLGESLDEDKSVHNSVTCLWPGHFGEEKAKKLLIPGGRCHLGAEHHHLVARGGRNRASVLKRAGDPAELALQKSIQEGVEDSIKFEENRLDCENTKRSQRSSCFFE